MVNIFLYKIDNNNNYEIHVNKLKLNKQDELKDINNKKVRNNFIIGNLLLDNILSNYYNMNNYEIRKNAYNKPFLNNNLFFNISHSNNLIGIAFSKEEIGLDIELIGEYKDNISKKIFNEKELEYFHSLDEVNKNILFYKYWTIKESIIKKEGLSLFSNLNNINMLDIKDDICINSFNDKTIYTNIIKYNNYFISFSMDRIYKYEIIDLTEDILR